MYTSKPEIILTILVDPNGVAYTAYDVREDVVVDYGRMENPVHSTANVIPDVTASFARLTAIFDLYSPALVMINDVHSQDNRNQRAVARAWMSAVYWRAVTLANDRQIPISSTQSIEATKGRAPTRRHLKVVVA